LRDSDSTPEYQMTRSIGYVARYWIAGALLCCACGNFSAFFPGDPAPVNLWIVGTLMSPGMCNLEFASPDPGLPSPPYVSFQPKKIDHEKILSYFDTTGIRVYLQVEPGRADIDILIDLVLSQFKHHPCVMGFGIDLEWFGVDSTTNETFGVTDALAQQWKERVQSHDPSYRLFLKHWEPGIMPPRYRGNIVYVSDSQGFGSLEALASDFGRWADYFSPNPVMFQIGYDEDYAWWKALSNPPKAIGEQIALKTKSADQEIGIIWVDFTLHPDNYPELKELFAGINRVGGAP
jgi:hypothetical protein